MRAKKVKSLFIATASVGALCGGLGISPAAADTFPFQINGNVLESGQAVSFPTQLTDINVTSDALITQTTSTAQTETGWAYATALLNILGSTPTYLQTGQVVEGAAGSNSLSAYNIYLLFQGTVNGVTCFGGTSCGVGTVGVGGYSFALVADLKSDDTFNAGATAASGGTTPTVTGFSGGNDIVLAVGTSIAGNVGFQATTGAPTFDVVANFILCNGTPGSGNLGGTTVAGSVTMTNWNGGSAIACGSFNAATYFVNPVPFYRISLNSVTGGSLSDLSTVGGTNGTVGSNVTLNAAAADINFQSVPEPSTLLLFGSGLLGLGMLARRRRNFQA